MGIAISSYRGGGFLILVEIDGTQDLMSSKARVTTDQLAGFEDDEEKAYMENYCYSYYAARKGIDPVFVFKHHLTKMDFNVIPAYNSTEQRRVKIHRIELRANHRARFTVADKESPDNLGLDFYEDEFRNLVLREEDGSEMPSDRYEVETLASETSPRDTTAVGTSMLISPAERYDAYVYMTEIFKDGTEKIYDTPLHMDVANAGGFLPGNGYVVNISVYGATRLEAEVSLVDWVDAGRVTIDDEEAWGNDGEF